MKILLHYHFSPEQVESFRNLANSLGGHEIIFVDNDTDAVRNAHDVEAILGWFKPPVCAAAENLRWIQSFSTGMEKFLFPEIIERDEVQISNVAGLYASQGAEHAWALLLALTRNIELAIENKKKRHWGNKPSVELAGSTLGLIGFGGFGVEMAQRAQGYRMTILAIDPVRTDKPDYIAELKPTNKENLHSLLRRSDVVMTACPLTAETYHLIGAEELSLMKPSAYLINVTRGGIIVEPDLVEALQAGKIKGAGIDVTEKEPLPSDSPLWDAPNLIITSHYAGASQNRERMVYEFFTENLTRFLKGERPKNVIDKRKGY